MKRIVTMIIAIFFSNSVFCTDVQVSLVKPESFFDLKADDSDSMKKLQNRFIEAMKGEVASLMEARFNSDNTIAIAIYDVDLAGSLNMVSYFGQMKMVRMISESTPPKLNVGYIVVDKNGKKLKSGAEILFDKTFQYKSLKSNNFEHERKLLRNWLNEQLD